MELTEATGVAGFRSVIPLREARYKSIVDLMKRRARADLPCIGDRWPRARTQLP